jgi:hypothetical protein
MNLRAPTMTAAGDLSTLDQTAAGRRTTALLRPVAEAEVRGLKRGRQQLLTEADYLSLVAYLGRRAEALGPRTAKLRRQGR